MNNNDLSTVVEALTVWIMDLADRVRKLEEENQKRTEDERDKEIARLKDEIHILETKAANYPLIIPKPIEPDLRKCCYPCWDDN